MRTAACILLLGLSTTALADDKPVKWEYAELVYRGSPGRPAGKDDDGKPVEAFESTLTIRWTSGSGEFAVKGWDELAEKLKTPLKKDGAVTSQRIQMLNALGSAGWELVSREVGATRSTTLMFKRRLP